MSPFVSWYSQFTYEKEFLLSMEQYGHGHCLNKTEGLLAMRSLTINNKDCFTAMNLNR
jgi:hypothetical protein